MALGPEVEDFKKRIDQFAEQSHLQKYFVLIASTFTVTGVAAKQDFKKLLAETYNWKLARFPSKMRLRCVPKYVLKCFAYIFYVFSKSERVKQRLKFEMAIEWVETELEAMRFSNLYKQFLKPVIVTVKPCNPPGMTFLHRPPYKKYNSKLVVRALFRFVTSDLWVTLAASMRSRTNLLPIYLKLLDTHLYYASLFTSVDAKFLIGERHYQTSALKNQLFINYGGLKSATIQKNIIHGGYSGFYYDIDCFFALGAGTTSRALQQGAHIRDVMPVGSMFKEYSWYTVGGRTPTQAFDVVYLGLNMIDFHNAYSQYLPDYYEHIRWMVQFAEKFQHYKLGIKHHANNMPDPQEVQILLNSKVQRIPHDFNSYEYAYAAKCVLTWGSTMGYECLGHGIPCLFLDPGHRDYPFLPNDPELEPYRMTTYEQFEKTLLGLLQSPSRPQIQNREFFCLPSQTTSRRIYDHLLGHQERPFHSFMSKSTEVERVPLI